MIYTCTLNPSIDYLVELEQVNLGTLNRAKQTSFFPGGKGINVSRVLKRLEEASVALGYIGGFTGEFIKNFLAMEGIQQQFIHHVEPTRVNIKLKTKIETEINGTGANISLEQQQALYNQISKLTPSDYLVLAGSLPSSISLDFYKSLAALCEKNGVSLIVDVSGAPLKEALPYKPLLIKPNQHELGELVGATVTTKEEAFYYGRKLLEQGPQNVIVSMGGEGAVFINKELTATATVPKGEIKSTVGAGDSTVAGFLAMLVKGRSYLESFQFGVASGTATAFSTDLCQREDVEKILPQIKIEQVI
ncbi:1-phosphofructokinase [Pseudoneobacillus sp. C159]